MSTWIELISEPIRSEALLLELFCREVIEFLPIAIICGIPILFGALWLLVVLDCMLLEDGHLQQSHDECKTGERHRGSSRDRLSQVATRLSQNEIGAAA